MVFPPPDPFAANKIGKRVQYRRSRARGSWGTASVLSPHPLNVDEDRRSDAFAFALYSYSCCVVGFAASPCLLHHVDDILFFSSTVEQWGMAVPNLCTTRARARRYIHRHFSAVQSCSCVRLRNSWSPIFSLAAYSFLFHSFILFIFLLPCSSWLWIRSQLNISSFNRFQANNEVKNLQGNRDSTTGVLETSKNSQHGRCDEDEQVIDRARVAYNRGINHFEDYLFTRGSPWRDLVHSWQPSSVPAERVSYGRRLCISYNV